MLIHYTCRHCGDEIGWLSTAGLDEQRLGFDCLTGEERQDIITFDELANIVEVRAICDACAEMFGLPEEQIFVPRGGYLH